MGVWSWGVNIAQKALCIKSILKPPNNTHFSAHSHFVLWRCTGWCLNSWVTILMFPMTHSVVSFSLLFTHQSSFVAHFQHVFWTFYSRTDFSLFLLTFIFIHFAAMYISSRRHHFLTFYFLKKSLMFHAMYSVLNITFDIFRLFTPKKERGNHHSGKNTIILREMTDFNWISEIIRTRFILYLFLLWIPSVIFIPNIWHSNLKREHLNLF